MNDTLRISHRCDHIGILTNNARGLLNFYTKKMDFIHEKEEILSGSVFKKIFGFTMDCRFIRLSAGDFMLELFEPANGTACMRTAEMTGLNHFGYCVKNRRDYVNQLRKKNVDIIEVRRNSHTVYFVSDPDGNRIEIRDCVKRHTSRKKGGKNGAQKNKSW